MNEERGNERQIKVVDRRWFTEDGDLRDDRPRTSAPAAPDDAPTEQAEAQADDQDVADKPGIPETSGPFVQLIDFLGQQAAALLTGAQGVPRRPDQAKAFIDMLTAIELKTKGSRSPEENSLMDEYISQLRMLYLQMGG